MLFRPQTAKPSAYGVANGFAFVPLSGLSYTWSDWASILALIGFSEPNCAVIRGRMVPGNRQSPGYVGFWSEISLRKNAVPRAIATSSRMSIEYLSNSVNSSPRNTIAIVSSSRTQSNQSVKPKRDWLGPTWVICALYRNQRTTIRTMNCFKNWQALLAFGLIACPVPLLGQICVVAALVWPARLGFGHLSGRLRFLTRLPIELGGMCRAS